MWQQIEAMRQTRPDYMVEVRVNGVWYLAHTLEWARSNTLGRIVCIGEWVKVS